MLTHLRSATGWISFRAACAGKHARARCYRALPWRDQSWRDQIVPGVFAKWLRRKNEAKRAPLDWKVRL